MMENHEDFHHDDLLERAVDAVLRDPIPGDLPPDQVAQLIAAVRQAADQPYPITLIERIKNMKLRTKIAVAAAVLLAFVGLLSLAGARRRGRRGVCRRGRGVEQRAQRHVEDHFGDRGDPRSAHKTLTFQYGQDVPCAIPRTDGDDRRGRETGRAASRSKSWTARRAK